MFFAKGMRDAINDYCVHGMPHVQAVADAYADEYTDAETLSDYGRGYIEGFDSLIGEERYEDAIKARGVSGCTPIT